jgi:hypothetical protein
MSHTIYAAKFEQTIIHQHVHLRRESQPHGPAHALIRLYLINKLLVCLQSRQTENIKVHKDNKSKIELNTQTSIYAFGDFPFIGCYTYQD